MKCQFCDKEFDFEKDGIYVKAESLSLAVEIGCRTNRIQASQGPSQVAFCTLECFDLASTKYKVQHEYFNYYTPKDCPLNDL